MPDRRDATCDGSVASVATEDNDSAPCGGFGGSTPTGCGLGRQERHRGQPGKGNGPDTNVEYSPSWPLPRCAVVARWCHVRPVRRTGIQRAPRSVLAPVRERLLHPRGCRVGLGDMNGRTVQRCQRPDCSRSRTPVLHPRRNGKIGAVYSAAMTDEIFCRNTDNARAAMPFRSPVHGLARADRHDIARLQRDTGPGLGWLPIGGQDDSNPVRDWRDKDDARQPFLDRQQV